MSSLFSDGFKFVKKPLPAGVSSKKIPIALHEHHAEKAGLHYDLRLAGKGDWAIRHFPTGPGEKRLAIRQPTHPLSYYSFSGEIKDGYGKGKVNLKYKGTGELHSWGPDKISFSFRNKNYVLIHTGSEDRWIIMMRNPMKKEAYSKKNDDKPLRLALALDNFSKRLREIGSRNRRFKKRRENFDYREHSIQLRALNPLDHNDVQLDQGPRTRAARDMAIGNVGF